MGGRFSRCGIVTSFDMVVEAPADIVWETLMDIDAMPTIVSAVQSIERIGDSSQKIGVGICWKETRAYNGTQVFANVSITHLSAEKYSISYGTVLDSPMNPIRGAASTTSVVVKPLDDKSCQVMGTFAVVSNSWEAVIRNMFCGCCTLKETNRELKKEFLEYFNESIRRYDQLKEDM